MTNMHVSEWKNSCRGYGGQLMLLLLLLQPARHSHATLLRLMALLCVFLAHF